MNLPEHSPLGRVSPYPDQYDPALLFPIARAQGRGAIGIEGAIPFFGADLWTAYEVSWLDPHGKPHVAIARFTIPCETPNLIESKSLKLYLNSYNGTRLAGMDAVLERIRADLSEAAWRGAGHAGTVGVQLLAPEQFEQERIAEMDGLLLDRLQVECTHDQPAPELLTAAFDEAPVEETLTSHLLKSNCPVTGQPDWGSLQIRYSGPQIEQAGLLRYLVSFRNHQGFHEQCVERIFMDLSARCRPIKLTVLARYTRRGGIDINPLRTSHPMPLPHGGRTARQ
ncbi:MAG: NADPH-dependent 7-cyano-7-deazaguanine reductase QueF [Comamonas sp. SCN 67-35]|mgnify:CR=1 FL=1|uniref:NADPH-dependent 7-cyano-7-deazaguanine reductase QueF n=1 Tax=unclassified Comamonas TaxID=2638500 RepID=UPI00086D38F9|nr:MULTISPECIES: NADPH-dependent 7-cyano-7-deazaguanine reductase QueF [unclassified Comamonas]MBN9331299.1 NADPH-dependent 7-cyano-7-deazaguanine reductase QueF [Comamonas sp.]ODU37035.1 MAG: NADPH-dependent 7-cyano-7-deazaguanine reductase QueF [Comamonas sp. SCN 67-35]OJW99263.1 MAG: NADPH-dependent 7-cyano-7-deazaguanine reductase QueF [Burkholderiales bacterium 66-26]